MTVNPQITDSVTQPDTKAPAGTPAAAMSNFHQGTAQALTNAFHNAVAGQQQSMIIAQAAAVQAVTTLYALDTSAEGVGTATQLGAANAAAAVDIPPVSVPAPHHLADADDFAYGMRAISDAFAASLDAMGKAACQNLLRTVQLAATTVCLKAMLEQPDKAAAYEEVLAAIRRIA